MDKISFVLTLKVNANPLGSDLERVKKILLPSLVRYFDLSQISQFLIIVPANEQEEVSRELKEFKDQLNLSVIPEERILALVPGWRKHITTHRMIRVLRDLDYRINKERIFKYLRLKNGWHNLGGWLKQQLLKMFSAKLIDSDYYMTLDSDLCLARPADINVLFPDGKAIVALDIIGRHQDWWRGSAQALDVNFKMGQDDLALSVTPEILSTKVVNNLTDHLIKKSRKHGYWTIFEFMSTNKPWTEYTLYWLFLLEFYKKEDYYTQQKQSCALHSDYCVWYRDEAPDIQTLRNRIHSAFRDNNGLFLVVQSVCIPLTEYYEAMKGYLSNN